MTQEELKLVLAVLKYCHGGEPCGTAEAISIVEKALAQTERDYERGFIDGMQKQMQSSVDKAVNAMSQRPWVGLTDDEQQEAYEQWQNDGWGVFYNAIEAKLKEKNCA